MRRACTAASSSSNHRGRSGVAPSRIDRDELEVGARAEAQQPVVRPHARVPASGREGDAEEVVQAAPLERGRGDGEVIDGGAHRETTTPDPVGPENSAVRMAA